MYICMYNGRKLKKTAAPNITENFQAECGIDKKKAFLMRCYLYALKRLVLFYMAKTLCDIENFCSFNIVCKIFIRRILRRLFNFFCKQTGNFCKMRRFLKPQQPKAQYLIFGLAYGNKFFGGFNNFVCQFARNRVVMVKAGFKAAGAAG